MIKRSIQEEAITFIKIHTPNIGAHIYIYIYILIDIKGENDNNTEIVDTVNPSDISGENIHKEKQ